MHAFTNWDLAAIALTGLGLWAWSRGSPTWAGALLGVGIATKLYPLFVLLALLMLCARAGKWQAAAKATRGRRCGRRGLLPARRSWSRSRSLFPNSTCTGAPSAVRLAVVPLAEPDPWRRLGQRLAGRPARVLAATVRQRASMPRRRAGRRRRRSTCCPRLASWWSIAGCRRAGRAGAAAAPGRSDRLPAGRRLHRASTRSTPRSTCCGSCRSRCWPGRGGRSLLIWQVAEVVLGAANLYALIGFDHSDQGLPLNIYLVFIVVRDVVLFCLMALVVRGGAGAAGGHRAARRRRRPGGRGARRRTRRGRRWHRLLTTSA